MQTVSYPHIEITADGVPRIAGTTIKVIEIVLDRLAWGWDAEQICRQHPHLSPSQVHAAFTYYYDHREELDRDIESRLARVEEIRARRGNMVPGLEQIRPS